MFRQRFSSTPRGARLARLLAGRRLAEWGIPYGTDAAHTAALVVGELAANAVTHGRVPGRDFELRLTLIGPTAARSTLRIEVTDTRTERRPSVAGTPPPPHAESGRGLLLVHALATQWTVLSRPLGKTVRAEMDLSHNGG